MKLWRSLLLALALSIVTASPGSAFTFPNGTQACLQTQYGIAGVHRASGSNGYIFFDNHENFIGFNWTSDGSTSDGTGLDWGSQHPSPYNPFHLYAGDCASALIHGHIITTAAGQPFYGTLNHSSGQGCGSSGPCYPCASANGFDFDRINGNDPLDHTVPINLIDALFGWYPSGDILAPGKC